MIEHEENIKAFAEKRQLPLDDARLLYLLHYRDDHDPAVAVALGTFFVTFGKFLISKYAPLKETQGAEGTDKTFATCPRCQVALERGQALAGSEVVHEDFGTDGDAAGATRSFTGGPALRPALKCPKCGFSRYCLGGL